MLSRMPWDQDVERNFNRMFRKRRLAARRGGRPFPAYTDARRQLAAVVAETRSNGASVDVRQFWDRVFAPWSKPPASK
jgi:hypothetical protein